MLLLLVLFQVVTEVRVKSYRTGQIPFVSCGEIPALYKGNLSSSITFDPDLGDYLEKDQQKQLSKSFHLTMGRASGVSTSLLGIDFPKANFEGIVWGLLGQKAEIAIFAHTHRAYNEKPPNCVESVGGKRSIEQKRGRRRG